MQPNKKIDLEQKPDYEYTHDDGAKKQRQAIIKGVTAAIIVAVILGGAAYGLWSYHRAATSSLQSRIDELNKSLAEASVTEVLPDGFVEYRNESAGFAFYYPEKWGAVRELDSEKNNIGSDYFYATFDALPAGRGPRGGGNTIAFGAPSRGSTLSDRGKIHTDSPGFTRADGRYLHVRSIFSDNQTSNITFVDNDITVPLEAVNTTGILVEESDSDYYGYSYLEGRFNLLSNDYNGINFVTSDPSYRDEFIQTLRTFRTL